MESATTGDPSTSKHTITNQKGKENKKVKSNASIIAQPAETRNRSISKNFSIQKGTPKRRQKSRIFAANNAHDKSLIISQNKSARSEIFFGRTRIQPAVQVSRHLNRKVNDVPSAMDSEACDFRERRSVGFFHEKRHRRNRLKKSTFCAATFAASTSAAQHDNAFASSNEPDVISLSEEENENPEADAEFTALDQDDDQLHTSLLVKKEVPKCVAASNELEKRKFMDDASPEKIGNSPILRNKQIEMNVVCRDKNRLDTEVPLKSSPLVVQKDSFEGFNLIPGTHKFVQNGEIELKIERPEGKDFIQIILFECCGPLEDPKHVVRGGYKICASAVLHDNSSVEIIREALIDLAEQLERISHDSFYPGEKLPYFVSKYSLPYLEKQYIYPLKKKSSRFPRAIYYCGLCHYHICSVSQSVTHFLSREHIGNRENAESLKKLKCLPRPTEEQMIKVDQIIQELYIFTRLADKHYEVGLQVATLLSNFLEKEIHKSYTVMIYGSYITKLATARSNLNLALNFSSEYSPGNALSRVIEVLSDTTLGKNFTIHSVSSDFQRRDPSVYCTVNSVPVVITANCVRLQRATQLVNLYCAVCSQFRILAAVFRSWAELCSLTNVQLGGMPKFAFDILLIYYLQRKGLLPFVFEILREKELVMLLDNESLGSKHQVDKINFDFGVGNVEWNFGEIWIDLFRYYAIEHPVEELVQIRSRQKHLSEDCTRCNRKRLAVEDPFAPDHIMQPQQRIYGYFSSCLLSTYFHFALPRTSVCSLIPYSIITPKTVEQAKKKIKRKSRKTKQVNNFHVHEDATNNDHQSNRTGSYDDNIDKDIKSPESINTQITKAGISKQEIDRVTETGLETTVQVLTNEVAVLHVEDNLDCVEAAFFQEMRMKELEFPAAAVQNIYADEEYDKKDGMTEVRLASASILKIKFHDYDEVTVRKFWLALNKNDYNYSWALDCFTSGLEPVIQCTSCNEDGHLRENCPELMIPKPKNFPSLTNAQKKMIDAVIFDIFNTMRIRSYYVHHMSSLCHELEIWLRRFYRADCQLSLFGSAGNGFGVLGSDADICLRFGPEVRPKDIDSAEVICKVAEVVRKMPNVAFVLEIPRAKVPIVKFRCRNHYNLEADVSLYNVLALENTRLLQTYSKLDRRIHQLGIMTKVWAKSCEIGNASKGSLSSYSYIIMLIHYLQRTNPPVAPFLQEIAPPGRCRKPVIIDDCDVYFCSFEDLKWTVLNTSTVGELWLGFLEYFGTKFDFIREVIQIRQTSPLMKLDKGWQSRPIAIEDPFDLTHNLSSGVRSKTMAYIQKSFIQSLEKFNTLSVPNSKLNHNALMFYETLLLSNCRVGGGPPFVRNCCHRCRQIGHFVVDCPMGMQTKKRNT